MKNFLSLLKQNNEKMKQYMNELTEIRNDAITDHENYWVFNNDSGCLITLVAHIDTVNDYVNEVSFNIVDDNIISNKNGILGADDRAGVYACMQLMDSCRVIFTNYEETGGQGVKKLCQDFPRLFNYETNSMSSISKSI